MDKNESTLTPMNYYKPLSKSDSPIIHYGQVTRAEFNALQRELDELRKMLKEHIEQSKKVSDGTLDSSRPL